MPSEPRPILLQDYRDQLVRHVLDEHSGLVTEVRFLDQRARGGTVSRRGVVGFGAWRVLGLWRSKYRVFVSVYASSRRLLLRVGTDLVIWPDASLLVRRSGPMPFIKQFEVTQGARSVLTVRYRHSDTETWPDNGDIFSYVQRATRSAGQVARTIAFWDAHAAGRDILSQEVANELDDVARAAEPHWHGG